MGDNPQFDLQQLKWYVLFVRSNQEKRVAERLYARGIEHFLPCYESMRQWKDRRVGLQLPLFPGYVFVRIQFAERNKALSTPQVVSLVGNKTSPSAISDEEIAGIRLAIEYGKAKPHPYLNVGERVVITQGALTGLEGLLIKIRNNTRVAVALHSIARAFVVEGVS